MKGFDIGAGPGKELTTNVTGGTTGIIFDARGRRPFAIPAETHKRVEKLVEWAKVMDSCDIEALNKYINE